MPAAKTPAPRSRHSRRPRKRACSKKARSNRASPKRVPHRRPPPPRRWNPKRRPRNPATPETKVPETASDREIAALMRDAGAFLVREGEEWFLQVAAFVKPERAESMAGQIHRRSGVPVKIVRVERNAEPLHLVRVGPVRSRPRAARGARRLRRRGRVALALLLPPPSAGRAGSPGGQGSREHPARLRRRPPPGHAAAGGPCRPRDRGRGRVPRRHSSRAPVPRSGCRNWCRSFRS